jgi:hypothetical protein
MKKIAKALIEAIVKLKCKMSCCCQSKCTLGDVPPSPCPIIKHSVEL